MDRALSKGGLTILFLPTTRSLLLHVRSSTDDRLMHRPAFAYVLHSVGKVRFALYMHKRESTRPEKEKEKELAAI